MVGWGVYLANEMMRSNSILCGDLAIRLIDEPFISHTDDNAEWAI